jgi:tetratricopeptide (TPR) repeat protein
MSKNKILNIIPTKNPLGKYYLILTAVIALVFGNTLFNGYNMDDQLVTQKHVHTSKGLSAVKDILSSNYYSNNVDINFDYRPLVHISFAIEHQFFGEHAGVSHFINLVLYLLTVLLLFKLCLKWFGENNINAALLASLIFAVHPIHTEAVASIKNRDELLALLFGLSAVYGAIKFLTANHFKWLVLAFISFSLSMLAKKSIYPIVVVMPIILLVHNRESIKKIILTVVLLSIPAAIVGSDFQLYRGILLMVIPSVVMFGALAVINLPTYSTQIKQLFADGFFKYSPLILAAITFVLGVWLKEISLVIVAIILSVRKLDDKNILILSIQLTILGAVFVSPDFHKYGLMLSLAYVIRNFKNITAKKVNYWYLGTALIPIVYFTLIQQNAISYVLIIQLTLFFILVEYKAIFALLFILISTTISIIFFNNHALNYILIAYATFKTFKNYHPNFKVDLKPALITGILLAAMLITSPIHSAYLEKVKQQYNRFQTEYLNNKPNEVKTTGRQVSYIENTLMGQYTRAELLATGFATIAEYARLTFYPVELSFYYGYAKVKTVNFSDKAVWFGLIFYLTLIAVALWQLKKHPIISLGIIWYSLSISLFSNWIEPVAGMVGERLAYTASVGFCLAFSALVFWLKPSFSILKPKGIDLFIIMVLVLFSFRSMSRNSDWKDPITLMENDIEHLENSAQAHNLLGLNLMYVSSISKNLSQQQIVEMQNKAAMHLQKSIEIYPNFFNTNFDLARVYIGWGDFAKAKPVLEQALKVDPENLFALEELAKTCYELKLVDETEKYANIYLEKIPQNENMHEVLIYNMLANGKYQSAINYAERALSYYPSNEIIQRMYADAKRLSGNTPKINQ